MRNLILLDKGTSSVHTFKKSLANKGYLLITARSVKNALLHLKDKSVDVMLISSDFRSEISTSGPFRKRAEDIPRIILIRQSSFHDIRSLLQNEHAVPVYEPVSVSELIFWIQKLLRDSSREEKNKQLENEIQAMSQGQQFIDDLSGIVRSSPDTGSLITLIERTQHIIGAGTWSLLLDTDSMPESIQLPASRKINTFTYKKGAGIVGLVMQRGVPVIVNDVANDRHFDREVDRHLTVNMKSIICHPLMIDDKPIGILRLINKNRGSEFTQRDVRLLSYAANNVSIVLERASLQQNVETLAVTDELTGLYNVLYLHRVLDNEVERVVRYGSYFSLIFMDIDFFKQVNDNFGHLVGSKILIELSEFLKKNLRKVDVIARYGGDEFVIILPQTPLDGGFLVAERLRQAIEKKVFLRYDDLKVKITASFGVVACPEISKNKEDLLNIADNAMYQGKFSTKNIVFAAK